MGQGYLLLGANVSDAVPRALRRVLPWAASTEPTNRDSRSVSLARFEI